LVLVRLYGTGVSDISGKCEWRKKRGNVAAQNSGIRNCGMTRLHGGPPPGEVDGQRG